MNEQNQVYIFVPGILSRRKRTWALSAVDWVHQHTPHKSAAMVYFSGALTRRLGQHRRVRQLLKKIDRYLLKNYRVHLVGHSNGCDIIRRALIEMGPVQLGGVHFIAAATPKDFDQNGLNDALETVGVDCLKLYLDSKDTPLWWGWLTRRGLGWAGLGYGSLGRNGPRNVSDHVFHRLTIIDRDGIGHSGWFGGDNFAETLKSITNPTLP